MNYDNIQSAWQSPRNRPSPEHMEEEKMKVSAKLRRRRRGRVIIALTTSIWLSVISSILVHNIMTRGVFVLADEWAVFPLVALPWAALIAFGFIRRGLRGGVAGQDFEKPVGEGVSAMLKENRLAQMRARILMFLHAAIVPVLAIMVWQLNAAGKTRPHELASMIVFFSVVIIASVGILAWHWRRNLRAEQKRLETLLQAYEA